MVDDLNQVVEATETQAVEVPQQDAPQEKPQETRKEYNMRMLREQNEAAERRIKELESRLQQAPQESQRQSAPSQDNDLNFGLDEHDIPEMRHLRQLDKKINEKLQALEKKSAEIAAETQMRSKYNDFSSVVTSENIKTLAAIYPSIYRSISATPDAYDQYESAYTMIKNLGIMDNHVESTSAIDRRIEQNKAKPRSAASVPSPAPESALARLGDYDRRILSDADRERKMREVEMYKRGARI